MTNSLLNLWLAFGLYVLLSTIFIGLAIYSFLSPDKLLYKKVAELNADEDLRREICESEDLLELQSFAITTLNRFLELRASFETMVAWSVFALRLFALSLFMATCLFGKSLIALFPPYPSKPASPAVPIAEPRSGAR